jgi:hypothetical protein
MTDAVVPVLIPYARFLECLERRSSIRRELARQEVNNPADRASLPADAARTGPHQPQLKPV